MYNDQIPAYETAIKRWNIIHAPVAAKAANDATFDADKKAIIDSLKPMMTTDAVPAESTRLDLPEFPYMPVERPSPTVGPRLSNTDKVDDITAGDYLFDKGAGRVQSGWLTLADKSARGYGTMGQSTTPVSYINPVQAS